MRHPYKFIYLFYVAPHKKSSDIGLKNSILTLKFLMAVYGT